MFKFKNFSAIAVIFMMLFFSFSAVLAEENVTIENELLEMEIDEIDEVPSTFGLWWRSIKESVSVAITFDPVKKVEKRLRYAEERMRIAERMSESENPKIQMRAEKMVNKANAFMSKIEANKDKLINKVGDREARLIRNIATYQLNREKIMDKLEEKLPEEKLERVREIREEGLENNKRLLNAINNENIPEDIKEHLIYVRERIEAHAEEIKEFRLEHQQLKDDIKAGDGQARKKLKTLQSDRIENIRQHQVELQNRREITPQIINRDVQDKDYKIFPKVNIKPTEQNTKNIQIKNQQPVVGPRGFKLLD